MNPIILTGHTRHIKDIAELCLASKRKWAARHDLNLIVLTDTHFPEESGHPSFQKLTWINAVLRAHEKPVIWLDADVLITNLEVPPSSLLPTPPDFMRASRDYNDAGRPPHKAWSAGNTAWMPCPEPFAWLEKAMQDEGARWGGLWDQDALQNCQPDSGICVSPPRYMNAVHPDFGVEASWQPGDFLIHFTGIPPEDRASVARRFLEKLEVAE